ncbi:hypothetical protein PtA15_1A872 [Puccinia triticina]|uniref:Uncharacterized protein n=1 Tax=Puccinia triticina TaxID=208348 RepID=A0ABY7CCD8_9BASI|nr:uncharacterized protein PtA15_1A872 [Puccinia triticina]WAQ81530.1 hypothetical protein PtA15_1A872 [Puccinia triticina]
MPARHRDTTSSGRKNHRMKGTGAGLPEHIQTNNAAGGPTPSQTLVFLTPSRAGMNGSERSLPPRLNGPLLRIRSNDNHDSRRVDSLFYGPVDPVLVDPSVNHY